MEEQFKAVAAQLRKPHGEYAKQVGEKMNEGNAHINRSTIQLLSLSRNDVILEIGMGNGFFVKEILLSDPTIRYIGCDFSESMITEAMNINSEFVQHQRARFIHTGAENIPVPDGTVDKIFTINTLYFWEDTEKIFAELRRVLKPEGWLVIAIRPKSSMQHYPFTKYGFEMYDRNDLEQLVEKYRFSVRDTIEIDEPEQEMNGQSQKVQSLIVVSVKLA